MKKITLTAWAAKEFDPPPSIRTLRSWAANDRISPKPVKVGRVYMVEETAKYVEAEYQSVETTDSVVSEIWNRV